MYETKRATKEPTVQDNAEPDFFEKCVAAIIFFGGGGGGRGGNTKLFHFQSPSKVTFSFFL